MTVLTLAHGFPWIADVMLAARAVARLTDARLAQVFDLAEDLDHAYLVMEWAGGDSLDDLLADGPLEPRGAAEIIMQSAEALAAAHATGVAHLCLTPGCVRWTPGGGVKITGLGVDAALAGVSTDDPALADTVGLGKLLHAALTAYWPGGGWPSLPPAPQADGYLLSPRQVRAGVPPALDAMCRQMLLPGRQQGPPPATPAALAAALNRVIPALAAPPAIPPHTAFTADTDFGAPGGAGHRSQAAGLSRRSARGIMRGRQPVATRVMASVAGALVVAAVGTGAWTLGHHGGTLALGSTPGRHPPFAGAAVRVLEPVAARGFDPLSGVADDPGDENTDQARFAIDSSPGTAWHTQYYVNNPKFGGLKNGTGLILDMGKPVAASSVTVALGPVPGANVRIEAGNSDTRSPVTLRTFTTISRKRDASGTVLFTARDAARGRFVLIWFTRLPPQAPGSASRFQAEVFNVTVRGTR